jgi:hypothetical protein
MLCGGRIWTVFPLLSRRMLAVGLRDLIPRGLATEKAPTLTDDIRAMVDAADLG